MNSRNTHKKGFLIFIISILIFAYLAFSFGRLLSGSLNNRLSVNVIKIVDGDTIRVNYQGLNERARLIGIDAPESSMNRRVFLQTKVYKTNAKSVIDFGIKSKEFVKNLVKPDDEVYLEFDTEKRDHYNRLLVYVWLPNGKMLNEEIIKAGYAYPLTVPPDVKYKKRFLQDYKEARKHKRGLWKNL